MDQNSNLQQHSAPTTNYPVDEGSPLLKGQPVDRPYTKPTIQNVDPSMDIPEPNIHAPSIEELLARRNVQNQNGQYTFDGKQQSNDNGGGSQQSSSPKDNTAGTFNPAANELPQEDVMAAAEQTADAALDAYEKLNELGADQCVISDRMLKAKIKEGLNIHQPIDVDIDGAQTVSLLRFVREHYNPQIREAFSLKPELREKVKPILTRVLAKRGAVMTDEQALIYYLGMDAVSKAGALWVIAKQNKAMLEDWMDESESYPNPQKHRQATPPHNPPPQPQAPAVQPSANVTMKLMITKSDEEALRSLGYSQHAISAMTTQEAETLIKFSVRSAAAFQPEQPQRLNVEPVFNNDHQMEVIQQPDALQEVTVHNIGNAASKRKVSMGADFVRSSQVPDFGDKNIIGQMNQLSRSFDEEIQQRNQQNQNNPQ